MKSLGIFLAIIGLSGAIILFVLYVAGVSLGDQSKAEAEKVGPEKSNGRLVTVVHEGHWFVLYDYLYRGGVVHHPDCPCLKKVQP